MESVEELCDYVALINKSKKVLEGKKEEIKELYNPHTFTLKYEGLLPENLQTVALISNEKGQAILKKHENASSEDILKELIGKIHIKAFIENEATMNDIFINAVQSTN
jgi:ABC-2 type transport system ATP-binding protein